MNILSLNGPWALYQQGDSTPIDAVVPGCVHTDLLAKGLLEDPFYADNEIKQLWIGKTDWRYVREFEVSPEFIEHDRILLRCYGLDTIAVLRLDGVEIGHANNMYRTWEFDVKRLLSPGTHRLEIDFTAPLPYAQQQDAERGEMAGWVEPMRVNSGAWIRKEPCNFGWDWGPKMITSGIWRDIELVAFNTTRLSDVLILQEHSDGRVDLSIQVGIERDSTEPLAVHVEVALDQQSIASLRAPLSADNSVSLPVTIEQPALWWPNDMGSQPLYTVTVTLQDRAGSVLDTQRKRIGLRTLGLVRYPDQWGEAFYFTCNGVPFFAKGANWIPASPYISAVQRADYEPLVRAAAAAHMNMLRVWGGGVYENDSFYDVCDELGITVWQDFMFACGTYPSFADDFMTNVAAEARDNVRRLRHHACIALWCGNNEIEQGLPYSDGWLESMSWEDYSRLFDRLLPSIVHELSPQSSYWPGSPHNPCGDRNDHNNPNCGDSHLWSVWHGKEPFEWYRTRYDRFCSEFGFQSFPEPETMYEVIPPEQRSITSYVMEHHQRSGQGNSTIIHYLLDWFRLPTSFESTLWLSQILQGLAMKYAVEHWRRQMPRSMGALYWQLNDMWPAPSWASLDWKGGWKALHYMAKRFFAPLSVSCLEDSKSGTVQFHVVNDHGSAQTVTLAYTVTDTQGRTLREGNHETVVPARTSMCAQEISVLDVLQASSTRDIIVWVDLLIDGVKQSDDVALFSRPKHLSLCQPVITVKAEPKEPGQYAVTLESDTVALYTWLELAGAAFSDNFFHLRPGNPKSVMVSAHDVANLRVRSLFDTYQPDQRNR